MTRADLHAIVESILAFAGSTIHGAAFAPSESLKSLADLGVLVPTGYLAEVACDECDEHHMASIIATGAGKRAVCLRSGLEFIPEGDLTVYGVRAAPLVGMLAESLDRQRRWAQPRVAPFLWSLGSFGHLNFQVGVYFLLQAGDVEHVNDAIGWLAREPRYDAVAVLTNERRDLSNLALPCDGRVVRLLDYICTNDRSRWELDRTRLAERVIPQRLLRLNVRGRPKSAYALAARLIPEVDRDGTLQTLTSKRARHRVVLAAARARHGDKTKLSREPCEQAFQDYLRANPSGERESRRKLES